MRTRRSAVAAMRRGSVLIIVLVTLVFASFALITFMDKAMNDLLVEHRDARTRRLRMEAYSAMETTLAVLHIFQQVDNGLHSPAEGWSDPLAFAGYTPSQDRTVDVAFEDESGKLSLPHADAPILSRLFQSWNVPQTDADTLADAMMGWMQRDHVYATALSPDYDQGQIPYEPPARPLRSYSELAAIDKVRDFFYDADGRPNDYWRRFVASVSLLDFAKSNINGARPDTLAALGQYDESQRALIGQFLSSTGQFQNQSPGFFKDPSEAQAIVGQGGDLAGFGTTISALRILITVHEGKTEFRLSSVVTLGNAAKVVQETATANKKESTVGGSQTGTPQQSAPDATKGTQTTATNSGNSTSGQNLRYPFTLLEIRENDEIPPVPTESVPPS